MAFSLQQARAKTAWFESFPAWKRALVNEYGFDAVRLAADAYQGLDKPAEIEAWLIADRQRKQEYLLKACTGETKKIAARAEQRRQDAVAAAMAASGGKASNTPDLLDACAPTRAGDGLDLADCKIEPAVKRSEERTMAKTYDEGGDGREWLRHALYREPLYQNQLEAKPETPVSPHPAASPPPSPEPGEGTRMSVWARLWKRLRKPATQSP